MESGGNIEIFGLDTPIGVGGVGGSGTRLIAAILQELGFYLGRDLNEPLDNLWFTLLFKRHAALDWSYTEFARVLAIFKKAMCGGGELLPEEIRVIEVAAASDRQQHDANWLSHRAASLVRECSGGSRGNSPWGWKEPNTHVVLPRLNVLMPRMRYIHVTRNGLDMAYGRNQNQPRLWGRRFLGIDPIQVDPRYSLKYWVAAHQRILDAGSKMGERFLVVNYDRLCRNPSTELPRLIEFAGLEASGKRLDSASRLIQPQEGIGRFKRFSREDFDPADVAFVRSIGFDTEWPV
jgi:Sulfotransferase family